METTANGNPPSTSGRSNNTTDTLTRAASGAHAVVDSMVDAADGATRKAKPAIDRAATLAHHAVDRTASAISPTADWLSEQSDGLILARKKLVADTSDYISANPLMSVGIAVAAGFMLSRMMR